MPTSELFQVLCEAFPTKREIKLDGLNQSLWVNRLDPEQLMQLIGLPLETTAQQVDAAVAYCAVGVTDNQGQLVFESEESKSWLRKQAGFSIELATAVREINEADGPSEQRKKKSEIQPSLEPALNSASSLGYDTQGS